MKVRSIRSKVLISIVGITLLTSAALAFVFYGRSAAMIEENYVTVLSQRTRLLADTIDDMMKNVCSIDMKASCDSEVKASLESYLKDGDEKRLSDLSTRLRIFAKMDQAISSVYLVIPDKRQVVTTMDYPVYKSGIEEEKIQQFLKKCGKDTGPVIMEDLVHNQEKLLQFIEEVIDTQGNVMGYVCTNIEEENLSYDYLEDPANQELDQMELIGNGKIIAARGLSQMGKDFPEKIYGKWTNHSEITGAGKETIYIYCEGSFSRCGIFASVKRSVILSLSLIHI